MGDDSIQMAMPSDRELIGAATADMERLAITLLELSQQATTVETMFCLSSVSQAIGLMALGMARALSD